MDLAVSKKHDNYPFDFYGIPAKTANNSSYILRSKYNPYDSVKEDEVMVKVDPALVTKKER